MLFRQLFFIESRLVAEVPRSYDRVFNEWHEPLSLLFFCSRCGDVYAKCPCLRADSSTTRWRSQSGICRKCGLKHQAYLSEWPGSVYVPSLPEYTAALPVAVLQWELERHLDSFERFPNGYQ